MASRDIDELRSPLGWAIFHASEDMISLLLEYGAKVLSTVDCDYPDWKSALMFAVNLLVIHGDPDNLRILDLLFAQVPDLEKHPEWENAFLHALRDADAYSGMEICEWVIDKTSSLTLSLRHTVIQNGWDVMSLPWLDFDEFCKEELLNLVGSLLMSRADIDSRSEDGGTIIQRMARGHYYECCSFLINHGADINTPATHDLGTSLQEAIKYEDVKMANLFLEHGADVNALPANSRGVTALQAASINGMIEMAIRLLELGADVSARAAVEEGRIAIDGAAEHGRLEMVQVLLNAYGELDDIKLVCNQAAGYAEKEDHLELVQWLREY